jgi:hypothetical protein
MQLAPALIDAHPDKRIMAEQNTQSRLLAFAGPHITKDI